MSSAAETRIIVNAIDNASKTIAGVSQQLSGMGKASKVAGDFAAGLGINLDQLKNPAMLAGEAVKFIGGQVKDSIDAYTQYAAQVRDLSVAYGIEAEEASALLQVADDLAISENTLKVAMRGMAQEGIQPSIEGLKTLITKYQGMKDPVEKAQFAMQVFGSRAGPEMTKLLEATPEAIDDIVDSSERVGLIMSGESLDAAEEYRLSLDALNDTFEGLKIQIGEGVVPALKWLGDSLMMVMTAGDKIDAMFQEHHDRTLKLTDSYEEYVLEIIRAREESGFLDSATAELVRTNLYADEVQNQFTHDTWIFSEAEFEAAKAVEHSTDAAYGMTGAYAEMTAEATAAAAAAAGFADETDRTALSLIGLTQAEAGRAFLIELNRAFEAGTISEEDYRAAAESVMTGMLDMTEAEAGATAALNDIIAAFREGELSAAAAQRAIDGVIWALNAADGASASMDVYINVHGSIPYIPDGGIDNTAAPIPTEDEETYGIRKHSGGPVQAGQSYLVGETGPELLRMGGSGQVINNWNLTINSSGVEDPVRRFGMMQAFARA